MMVSIPYYQMHKYSLTKEVDNQHFCRSHQSDSSIDQQGDRFSHTARYAMIDHDHDHELLQQLKKDGRQEILCYQYWMQLVNE